MKKLKIYLLYLLGIFLYNSNGFSQYSDPDNGYYVDSLIVTYSNGDIKKETYLYDNNGNFNIKIYEHQEGAIWIKDERENYSYDINGKLLIYSDEDWDGNNWHPLYRINYTYDERGNEILHLGEAWTGLNWIESSRTKYSYDSNNNLTMDQYEVFNNNSNKWEQIALHEYEYDSENNLIHRSDTSWKDGVINYMGDFTFKYDDNGNKIEDVGIFFNGTSWSGYRETLAWDNNGSITTLQSEQWDGNNWVLNYKDTFINDENGKRILQFQEDWDGTKWINSTKDSLAYDNSGNLLIRVYYIWQDQDWLKNSRYIFEYNSSGNETLRLKEQWDGENWINNYRYITKYDENGNVVLLQSEKWDGELFIFRNDYLGFRDGSNNLHSFYAAKLEIYYSTLTNIKTENSLPEKIILYQNYPNPYNPTTTIKYSIPASQNPSKGGTLVQLRIYDILGRDIAVLVNKEQKPGYYEVKWEASDQPSGIYFYRLTAGMYVETKKMVLLR